MSLVDGERLREIAEVELVDIVGEAIIPRHQRTAYHPDRWELCGCLVLA
jgi:hypothetical protein